MYRNFTRGKDKEAVLFVGSSGSGKTLLALEMNKRGYEFLSNENTVIDSNYIYGGTTTVNLKDFISRFVSRRYI